MIWVEAADEVVYGIAEMLTHLQQPLTRRSSNMAVCSPTSPQPRSCFGHGLATAGKLDIRLGDQKCGRIFGGKQSGLNQRRQQGRSTIEQQGQRIRSLIHYRHVHEPPQVLLLDQAHRIHHLCLRRRCPIHRRIPCIYHRRTSSHLQDPTHAIQHAVNSRRRARLTHDIGKVRPKRQEARKHHCRVLSQEIGRSGEMCIYPT